MQAVIGAALLKTLKPADKPYEVRDTKLKGFLLRVQPAGGMSYYAEYARGKRVSIGPATAITPSEARDKARELLAKAHLGTDLAAEKRKARAQTLGDFLTEFYEPWALAHIRTGAATVKRFRTNFADLLPLKLGAVSPLDVERWRAERLTAVKPSTVNRDITDLKSILAKAVEWKLLTAHPLSGAAKPVKLDRAGVVRFLSEDEEAALRAALDEREARIRDDRDSGNAWRRVRGVDLLPDLRSVTYADHLKPLVLVSLNTGMRKGEVFGLTWADVSLDRREIAVVGANAKSGQTRHIPLNDEALDVLTAWKAQTGGRGLVFPGREGAELDNVRKSWDGVLAAACITDFRWHDLRHTFASKLVMVGVDLNTVRELLGHSDIKMTLRYAHLAPEHKAAAVAKLVRA